MVLWFITTKFRFGGKKRTVVNCRANYRNENGP